MAIIEEIMKESQLFIEVFIMATIFLYDMHFYLLFKHLILQQFKYKSNDLHSVFFQLNFPFSLQFSSLFTSRSFLFSLMAFTEVLNPVFIIWVDSFFRKHVVFASDHKRTQFPRELRLKKSLWKRKAKKHSKNTTQSTNVILEMSS